MTVFKNLGRGGHTTQPIKVYASQSFTWISGSTSTPGFSINLANEPPSNYPIGTQDLGGITNGGMYSYLLYKSIEKIFYEERNLLISQSINREQFDPGVYSGISVGISSATGHGQSFPISSSIKLSEIGLRVYKNSSSTSGSATVRVYNAIGNPLLPDTASGELGSVSFDVSTLNTIENWKSFDFTDENVYLQKHNSYTITIEFPEGNAGNVIFVGMTSSGAIYSGSRWNGVTTTIDPPISGGWSDFGVDFYFRAIGTESISRYYDNSLQFYPSSSMYVWNIGSNYIGEQIKPNSFKIQISGSANTIQDDGKGKVRLNQTGDVLGNIFYEYGIVVVQKDIFSTNSNISSDGLSIQSGSQVETTYLSTINIYEHTISCTINPSEYNRTFNPSVFTNITQSQTFNNYLSSGSVKPYITQIGLYNDQNELLAIGKLSVPIQRTQYTDQTFVVKFDE